jgi:hypothetical protein
MSQDNAEPGYKILGVDDAVYGPIDMPTLVEWVQDERIVADTWIYLTESDAWKKASNLRELGQFFAISKPATGNLGFKPGSLRRVKVLADLSNDQLVEFAGFMEVHNAKQWQRNVSHPRRRSARAPHDRRPREDPHHSRRR